jgi:hypothetical protein
MRGRLSGMSMGKADQALCNKLKVADGGTNDADVDYGTV